MWCTSKCREVRVKVRGEWYRLVPDSSGDCKNCDLNNTRPCKYPQFNDYTLCSDLDCVFKKIKINRRKNKKGKHEDDR